MASARLYDAPRDEVDYDLVRQFVEGAEAADLFTESLTFEAKEKRNGFNVADAVCAFSNTDSGLVLLGVKDRDAVGVERIVGVTKQEHDALVSHLHSVMPTAMPEIVPVAIPGTDRLVIVVRADADAVLHPVVVNGRVLYRLPGQNAPADRQRILDMIVRDAAAAQDQSGPMQIITRPWRPQDFPLWPESDNEPGPHGDPGSLPADVSGELRVVGGLLLPRGVLDRPWLDTAAKQGAVDALNNAPLRASPHWALQAWRETHARSGEVSFEASRVPNRVIHAETRAHMRLSGRNLALLVGFRWAKVDGAAFRLGIDAFHDALLASMVTVAATCAHVAKRLGTASPTQPRIWESWLTSTEDNALTTVELSRFLGGVTGGRVGAFFPGVRVPMNDLAHLDRAARNWLTYWLLDIGAHGFEQSLEGKPIPDWLRWPDLA